MKTRSINKDLLATWTAALAFIFGIALTTAGFIVEPLGQVHDSILWILGQTLLYCGAVVGISTHYSTELRHFKREIATFVHEEEHKKYSNNDIYSNDADNSLDDSVEEE